MLLLSSVLSFRRPPEHLTDILIGAEEFHKNHHAGARQAMVTCSPIRRFWTPTCKVLAKNSPIHRVPHTGTVEFPSESSEHSSRCHDRAIVLRSLGPCIETQRVRHDQRST